MGDANQIAPSDVALLSATTTEITLPEGYKLVQYTLRRTSDGLLQSYQAPYRPLLNTGPLPATPTDTLDVGILQWSRDSSDSVTPTPLPAAESYQQLFNVPIRGGRERLATADSDTRTVSARTQKRHNESGENGYTIACGVICPELAPPMKKVNPKGGGFYCPRCGSNFTRAKSVKDHFPGCISKYGNPRGLRYTDHESMWSESPIANVDQDKSMNDQGIKTEFVYGADIALRSIESHASSHQVHSTFRGSSVSLRYQEPTPWSPNWRRKSETPNPGYVPAATPGWEFGMGYVQGQTPAPEQAPWSPNWRRQSETPNPGYVPAATPGWEFGMGYVQGQTPAPVSRASTPASSHSGSVTPTPASQQFSNRTPTPVPRSTSSATPSRDSSEETEGFNDGDSMEE